VVATLLAKPAFEAFQDIIEAITFPTSGDTAFASVFFSTGSDLATRLWPKAVITVSDRGPYGDHGDRLNFFGIVVEIRQEVVVGDAGEGNILDLNRTTDEAAGAGLADLHAKLVSLTKLLRKTDNAAIRPYIRLAKGGGSGYDEQKTYAYVRVNYDALLEIASAA